MPGTGATAVCLQTVLRRLKAFDLTCKLQGVLGPLLDGSAQPLLLKPPELVAAMRSTTCHLGDLAALMVRQPVPPRVVVQDSSTEGDANHHHQQQQQRQKWAVPAEAAAAVAEAQLGPAGVGGLPVDPAVLQQLLSGRVLELVKAAVTILSIHCSKQQVTVAAAADATDKTAAAGGEGEAPHPTEAPEAAQRTLENLLVLHRGLLSALRHLMGVILGSPLGWGFCAAAGADLQDLAAAISPGTQPTVLQIGGEPAPKGPNREAVMRSAQQAGGRLAEQLSSSLQCHVLVAAAVAQLAQPLPAGGGSCSPALLWAVSRCGQGRCTCLRAPPRLCAACWCSWRSWGG
jgi:hypothetical protein